MMVQIKYEDGEFGCRAVPSTSEWSQAITRDLLENTVVELELNHAKGWKGIDLSFLADLPRLKSIIIIDWRIASVEPIHCLTELRALKVSTYCSTEIRFSAFPRLERCSLEWRPKADTVFDCTTLKSLFLNRYNGKDTGRFTKLVNLESLGILNAPVDNLHGLSSLKKLRSLRLGNLRRLISLAGIEDLTGLEELDINTCRRICSIDEVGSLVRLKKFYLNNCGDIASLKPLEKLESLTSVLFYESTNILDGDLTPLVRNKALSSVAFKNRRHYSHRREDFGVAYTG